MQHDAHEVLLAAVGRVVLPIKGGWIKPPNGKIRCGNFDLGVILVVTTSAGLQFMCWISLMRERIHAA